MCFYDITEDNIWIVVDFLLTQKKKKIFLIGEVGSGKTTLTKYICRKLNIDNVLSPTFTIVNIYEGTRRVYHIDLYRLSSIDELYNIGLDEILSDSDSFKIVEWANIFPEILFDGILVEIIIKNNEKRDFLLKEV